MTFDPSTCPVYLNLRDRVRDLAKLVDWLERAGHQRIVLLDNDSEWPPLLEYLEATPHQVIRFAENLGSRSIWATDQINRDEWFVFSDPDLMPIQECPADAVARMYEMAEKYARNKVGFGLYLRDVPPDLDSLLWEQSLVRHELEQQVYDSLIDTTFALYRPGTPHSLAGIRLGFPYQCRHLPWYQRELDDEDRFYLRRAVSGPLGSSWAQVADF